jgi:hypothetical protein
VDALSILASNDETEWERHARGHTMGMFDTLWRLGMQPHLITFGERIIYARNVRGTVNRILNKQKHRRR